MKPFIALIVLVLLVVAGYFAFTYRAAAPVDENTPMPAVTTDETSAVAATITYTDTGFSPENITVSVGDTVRFVNNSSHGMWVGSDDHPTHTHYDGTSTREHCADGAATTDTFDQCTSSPSGTTWEYTFTKAGTWGYHNHSRSGNTGTVTVTE